ncbi:MAG: phosphohistidine phosphatase SixA [Opitutae bacterium]|nr:phosphohistidine phosphatase SixA [Opitutae bacterium]
MHLYLVRHAHALGGEDDAVRPLSGKGIAQIREIGATLRKADAVEAEEVWHSPLLRAQDTAERLAGVLRLSAEPFVVAALRPEDDPKVMAKRLNGTRHPVMLVGHEPHLSALASLLVTGKEEPVSFVFKKCAVMRLDRKESGWVVRWLISPEVV